MHDDSSILHAIAAASSTSSEMSSSERLARQWFATVERGDFDRLPDLVHEDVRIVSRIQPGFVVQGRNAVARYIEQTVAEHLYEAVPEVYEPIDDARIGVEGRMRWIDDERVIRDDPVVWAMEFRDDLLLRFLPARSLLEAESLLASER